MMNPMKNLGATLMHFFAWGSIWSIGYLVKPMFLSRFADSDALGSVEKVLTELTQLNLLLAFICLVIYVLTRLKAKQWQIKSDTSSQLTIAALLLIVLYFIFNKTSPHLLPMIYGLISVVGIASVSFAAQFSKPEDEETQENNNT